MNVIISLVKEMIELQNCVRMKRELTVHVIKSSR